MLSRLTNYFALLASLCIPLSLLAFYSGLLFPFVTSKAWALRLLVVAGLLGLLCSPRFLKQVKQCLRSPVFLAFIAYGVWALFSNQLSNDPSRAFWSSYERLEGGLGLSFTMMLVLLLGCTLHNNWRKYGYLLVLLAVLMVLCSIGLMEEGNRVSSRLGNPIYFGTAMALGLFLLGYFGVGVAACFNSVILKSVIAVVVCCASALMLTALYRSGSRGPAFGFVCGLITFVFSWWCLARKPSLSKSIVVGILVLASSALVIWSAPSWLSISDTDTGSLLSRLLAIPAGNQTTLDRFDNWSVALEVVKQRPIIGQGQEAYVRLFSEHYHPGVLDNADLWFDRAHNVFLDVLVAHGVVGFILFLLVFVAAVYVILKQHNISACQQALLIGLISCYLVKNLVGFDDPSASLILLSVLGLLCANQPENDQYKAFNFSPLAQAGAQLSLIGLTVLFAYQTLWIPLRANATMMNISLAIHRSTNFSGPIEQARLKNMKQALAQINTTYPSGKPEYLQALYAGLVVKDQLSIDVVNWFYQQSRALVGEQPNNHRIQYNAAVLLGKFGQVKMAIQMFEHLVQQTPKRTVFWRRLAELYQADGQATEAARVRQIIAELNPRYSAKLFDED